MSSSVSKPVTDVNLIWVVPKVKDPEYSSGDSTPIEVIVFPYLIKIEIHVLDKYI